jgi:hypothetical protein
MMILEHSSVTRDAAPPARLPGSVALTSAPAAEPEPAGGPNFLDDSDIVAAITITGDAICRATNVVYRLDTASARAF